MSTWFWTSKQMERKILEDHLKHVEKVVETTRALEDSVSHVRSRDLNSFIKDYEKISSLEREADVFKRTLMKEVSQVLIHPIDREYLINLTLNIDQIAGYCRAVGKRILILMEASEELDEHMIEYVSTVASKIRQIAELILSALQSLKRSAQETIEYTNEIEKIEEETDDLKLEAYKIVLKKCNEKSIEWCILSKEIIDTLEEATDRGERVADIIRMLAVSLS
jgi:predicted phosphate transport protein (TIGR00153 family)